MKRYVLTLFSLLIFTGIVFAQSGVGGGGQTNVSGGGGASGPLTPTNFPATTAGVFTNTQNDPFLFSTNGNGTCSPSNIITSNGVNANNKLYDGLTSCVTGPTSGTANSFSVGIAGLFQGNDSGSGGSNGWDGGVGVVGEGLCTVNNARCWGANFGASDVTGHTGNQLIGNEIDMQVNNNSTTGWGMIFAFQGNGQPTLDNMPAVAVTAPNGTGKLTTGFECQDGTTNTGSSTFGSCFSLGQQATGSSQSGQFLLFKAHDGGASFLAGLQLLRSHVLQTGAPIAAALFSTNSTATAALTASLLVKIDTANPNAVVVCTTADTVCHGFVAETVINTACILGGTGCPIVTVPGSKVAAILGTGTCAIGNAVVIDTTTNGRVKCTALAPNTNAMVGIALSAQAVVGNTLNVLTYFNPQATLNTVNTASNCASGASPAVCGSAAAGDVAVPTGATPTLQINTTAVTAN